MPAETAPCIPPDVAARAVEWLLALQDEGATPATRQAWERWRTAHPDHARAWERIERVNARLQHFASPEAAAAARAALLPPRSRGRREAVKALALLLFAGGIAWTAEEHAPWREWLADERTAVGERRSLVLADGTVVSLNTDSAIDVRFSATERRVRLVGGEIMVVTGKDGAAPRPFLVETEQGELQPLGTRFTARRLPDASRVSVFEGAVAIRPRDGAGLARTLRAGEQASFTRTAIGQTMTASEADTAWADGMIVATRMRLDDFLAELGRHRPGRLRCDPAVAGLRVSGTFPLADTDRILDALRTTLPVRIAFLTRYWVTVQAAD
ncbi:FecR domain-containing protein [Cupriavidus sp. 30B13]|uniref:FecR domain-containing protein n=1 Tax=Cupriavidus sp. 30B13 TaxID=3384241 RepID=UPI003B900906